MKITVLVCNLSGGGAERVASLWVKGFVERGHQVSVVLNNQGYPIQYRIPENVAVHNMCIPASNKFMKYIKYPFRIPRLHRILKEINPDVVVSVLHPMGLYALLAKGRLKYKIVNTEHNSFDRPDNVPLNKWEHFNKFYINRLFNRVTILTESDRAFIADKLNNITVLPNPLTVFGSKQYQRKKCVVAAGRLGAWYVKGFDVLIKAWSVVHINHPDWSLIIAGEGDSKSKTYLETLIMESQTDDSIRLVGHVNDMPRLYGESEIFVLSSRYEGFGMVLLEAMAAGCACIACDFRGRQKEIIGDDSNGVVYNNPNPNVLAECISHLIEDDLYRSTIQNNAVKRANSYSLENIMDKWESIFECL